MKGLVIDEPWVSLILGGSKTWEMRTSDTSVRGRIALIRKGSGQIVGLVDIVDSFGPLDEIAWRAHRAKHCIPDSNTTARERWNHAWVLDRVIPFQAFVSYKHPPGAVIWVNLDSDTEQRCMAAPVAAIAEVEPIAVPGKHRAPATEANRPALPPGVVVPVASDGTFFGPHLERSTGFTVGAKGEEVHVKSFEDALAYLRKMAVPRWRRPNLVGNWGIVSGKKWQKLGDTAALD